MQESEIMSQEYYDENYVLLKQEDLTYKILKITPHSARSHSCGATIIGSVVDVVMKEVHHHHAN